MAGDARGQGISSHGSDLVVLEYFQHYREALPLFTGVYCKSFSYDKLNRAGHREFWQDFMS